MRRSNRMKEIMRDAHDRIDAELHTVGLQRFGAAIALRMELIEVLAARFNNDSRTIRRICLAVLDRMATVDPGLQCKLDEDSRRDMSIAAYLHDIGKSGPFDAPQATQEAILKLYAVENVADPQQTIAETARTNFSSEHAESMLERLGSCGCIHTTPCAHSGIAMVTGRTTFSKRTRKTYRPGRGLSPGAITWTGE